MKSKNDDIKLDLKAKINILNTALNEFDKRKYIELKNILLKLDYSAMASNLSPDTFIQLSDDNISRILEIINLNENSLDNFMLNLRKYRNILNTSHNREKVKDTENIIQNVLDQIQNFIDHFEVFVKNQEEVYGEQIVKCNKMLDVLDGKRIDIISPDEYDEYRDYLRNNSFDENKIIRFINECNKLNVTISLDNNLLIDYDSAVSRLSNEYLSNVEYINAVKDFINNNIIDISELDIYSDDIAISQKLDIPLVKNTLITILAIDFLKDAKNGKEGSIEKLKALLDLEEIIKTDYLKSAKEILRNFNIDEEKIKDVNPEDRTTSDLIENEGLTLTQALDFRCVPLVSSLQELISNVENLNKTDDKYENEFNEYINSISQIVDMIYNIQGRKNKR